MSSSRMVRTIKRFYYRFLRIRGTPKQISLGFALGVFIGMTPFLGFHTIIAIMSAALFGWSKITAGLGVFVTNPFTAPFIYPLTYRLGAKVTGFSDPSQWSRLFEPDGVVHLLKESPIMIVDLLVGGAIVGLPLAFAVYPIAFHTVSRARNRLKRRKARHLAKKAALLRKARQAVDIKGRAKKQDIRRAS